jgi:hypothetical protein
MHDSVTSTTGATCERIRQENPGSSQLVLLGGAQGFCISPVDSKVC